MGSGTEAKTLDQVEVKYVGALYETGKEFDSSWKTSPRTPLPFRVGTQGTVPGFAIGADRHEGRRPPPGHHPGHHGYGAEGSPPAIPADATLVFVVDLVKVSPPVGVGPPRRQGPLDALSKAQREELPDTSRALGRRTPRAIFAKTHDSAVETYGEGERAHRTAFAALKHSYEKVGDHWEPKAEKGPSDDQAARTRDDGNVADPQPTAGGVDAHASKKHLYDLAKRLGVEGRSKMDKDELVQAVDKANRRETARARRS